MIMAVKGESQELEDRLGQKKSSSRSAFMPFLL